MNYIFRAYEREYEKLELGLSVDKNIPVTSDTLAKAVGENTEAIVVHTISEVRKASDKEDHDKQRRKKNFLIRHRC